MPLLACSMLLCGGLSSDSARAWKTGNHPLLADFAIEVLEDDGYTYLVSYLVESESLERFQAALVDCDRLDLALNHYYDPITGGGLLDATPATEIAQDFFDNAVGLYEAGDVGNAWYYFGWSLHVVQDLMVPFHSNLQVGGGHLEYETFADEYKFFFPLPENGTYGISQNASQWVVYAAQLSDPYYEGISGENATEANFDAALEVLSPITVGLTAGYIKFFADTVGVGDFNLYVLVEGINFARVSWDEVLDPDFVAYELWVADDRDDVFDGDPYARTEDRGLTEKTITGLTLGEKYYVRVRAIGLNGSHLSNIVEVSPHYPLVFFIVPGVTALMAVVILLSKQHRRRRKVMK